MLHLNGTFHCPLGEFLLEGLSHCVHFLSDLFWTLSTFRMSDIIYILQDDKESGTTNLIRKSDLKEPGHHFIRFSYFQCNWAVILKGAAPYVEFKFMCKLTPCCLIIWC